MSLLIPVPLSHSQTNHVLSDGDTVAKSVFRSQDKVRALFSPFNLTPIAANSPKATILSSIRR